MEYELHLGDCLATLRAMPDNSVDSIVTDPPYGLTSKRPGGRSSSTEGAVMKGFMGLEWDGDVPSVEIWVECLRVLKPGGHLLAFAGTRTQHRMACRIEDAGFEIRDMIAWIYGSGFPKSLNVAKAIESGGGRPEDIRKMQMGEGYEPSGRGRINYDHGAGSAMDAGSADWQPSTEAAREWQGWGTALKPALEPITVARKPLIGTVAANVIAFGTGALNINDCRVEPTGESRPRSGEASQDQRYTENGGTNFAAKPGVRGGDPAGRWPANLIHDGSDDVVALFPNSDSPWIGNNNSGAKGGRMFGGGQQSVNEKPEYRDAGSAARFFYCAKTSKKDRNDGLDAFPETTTKTFEGGKIASGKTPDSMGGERTSRNSHPTVKPTELMAYLLRLVTPPGGTALDPFMGSGSTGKAAMREGFKFIGCEIDEQYAAIARARIDHEITRQQELQAESDQLDLFGTA